MSIKLIEKNECGVVRDLVDSACSIPDHLFFYPVVNLHSFTHVTAALHMRCVMYTYVRSIVQYRYSKRFFSATTLIRAPAVRLSVCLSAMCRRFDARSSDSAAATAMRKYEL